MKEYERNEQFALECRMLAAIAFVPIKKVEQSFKLFTMEACPQLQGMVNYFEKNYIGVKIRNKKSVKFEPKLWNVCDATEENMPKTNNYLEGWHNRINSSISCHPSLAKLIRLLKKEQQLTMFTVHQVDNYVIQPNTKTYIDKCERIKLIMKDYSKMDNNTYLKTIALYLKF